jgi:hypothetical protein
MNNTFLMRQILLFILLLSISFCGLKAQSADSSLHTFSWKEYNKDRIRISQRGMIVLTSWAGANIVESGIGWSMTSGSQRYFHQGNVYWNVGNLAISIPGLIGASKFKDINADPKKSLKMQKQTELTYLINFGLDFAYTGTGAGLWAHGHQISGQKNADKFTGFGQALVMQGAFLALFDITMFSVHHQHWQHNKVWANSQLSCTGTGLYYAYHF